MAEIKELKLYTRIIGDRSMEQFNHEMKTWYEYAKAKVKAYHPKDVLIEMFYAEREGINHTTNVVDSDSLRESLRYVEKKSPEAVGFIVMTQGDGHFMALGLKVKTGDTESDRAVCTWSLQLDESEGITVNFWPKETMYEFLETLDERLVEELSEESLRRVLKDRGETQ